MRQAAFWNDAHACKLFIRFGASTKKLSNDGETPIDVAQKAGYSNVVELLVNAANSLTVAVGLQLKVCIDKSVLLVIVKINLLFVFVCLWLIVFVCVCLCYYLLSIISVDIRYIVISSTNIATVPLFAS